MGNDSDSSNLNPRYLTLSGTSFVGCSIAVLHKRRDSCHSWNMLKSHLDAVRAALQVSDFKSKAIRLHRSALVFLEILLQAKTLVVLSSSRVVES